MAVFLVADVMVPGLRKRRYSQEMVSGMLMKQEHCVVVLSFLFFFFLPQKLLRWLDLPNPSLQTKSQPRVRLSGLAIGCPAVGSRAAAALRPQHQHPACCLLPASAAPASEGGGGGYLFKSNACVHLLETVRVKNRSLIPGCSAICFLPKEKLRYGQTQGGLFS